MLHILEFHRYQAFTYLRLAHLKFTHLQLPRSNRLSFERNTVVTAMRKSPKTAKLAVLGLFLIANNNQFCIPYSEQEVGRIL